MATYERINDLMYILSSEIKLVFSVVLNSRSEKGVYNYHREFEYYKQGEKCISIKREASSSLNFKIMGMSSYDDITILPQHFDRFYQLLSSGKKWFDGTTQVFYKKGNKLFIAKDNPQRSPIVISELVNNKWISIEPIVILSDDDISSPGIRICFNNQITIDITVDRYYGLVHVLTGFNMYMAMSLLLNYVNTCTPGTNIIQVGDTPKMEESVVGVNGRRTAFKKSIFDD